MLSELDCAIAQLHFSEKERFEGAVASTSICSGVVIIGVVASGTERAIAGNSIEMFPLGGKFVTITTRSYSQPFYNHSTVVNC